mmetsp:Transcript_15279/g.32159  ORF Transcript_15279/g.32159 Transcript_15279/m.32159 type:complete len:220 (+) Transcript_15279:161-820(+)
MGCSATPGSGSAGESAWPCRRRNGATWNWCVAWAPLARPGCFPQSPAGLHRHRRAMGRTPRKGDVALLPPSCACRWCDPASLRRTAARTCGRSRSARTLQWVTCVLALRRFMGCLANCSACSSPPILATHACLTMSLWRRSSLGNQSTSCPMTWAQRVWPWASSWRRPRTCRSRTSYGELCRRRPWRHRRRPNGCRETSTACVLWQRAAPRRATSGRCA